MLIFLAKFRQKHHRYLRQIQSIHRISNTNTLYVSSSMSMFDPVMNVTYNGQVRMVPDNTIHMVTSKRHKKDLKHPVFGACFSAIFLNDNPTTPAPLSKMMCAIFLIFHSFTSNSQHSFCSFFLNPKPQNIYLSVDLSFYRFSLVCIRVRREKN